MRLPAHRHPEPLIIQEPVDTPTDMVDVRSLCTALHLTEADTRGVLFEVG